MWKRWQTILMLLLITPVSIAVDAEEDDEECRLFWDALPYIAAGAGLSAVALPYLLTAAGFTAGGIAAKSIAAILMKWSAVISGGGVPGGGVVAFLQSIGAKGLASYMAAFPGGALGYIKYLYDNCGGQRKSKVKK